LIKHIESLDLFDVCSLKPLLDGKQLAKALDTKPGPWMKDALDVVMAWQLRNPGQTDPAAAIEAARAHRNNGELASDLVRHFLKLTIRPLFVKASPRNVTDQGRKGTTPLLPPKFSLQSPDDSVTRPWKYAQDASALDLLRWVVSRLHPKLTEEVWPLIVPPVLTLIDDWEVKYKQIGIALLKDLLEKTPPALLARTGLSEVFEEALMPCLTYLPTLSTPEESVAMLSITYATLLVLTQKRYPNTALPSSSDRPALLEQQQPQPQTFSAQRTKMLDTIIRKGIIYGYTTASEYPTIVTTLYTNLSLILEELGIDSVKHIKYVLPMLTQSLSHPHGIASLTMLESAVTALQALLRNCWPRMALHRAEVLKGLCLCWLNVEERESSDEDNTARLRATLRDTVSLLRMILQNEEHCDFEADVQALVAADSRLRSLLLQMPQSSADERSRSASETLRSS
jgi:hypothetical protein